MVEHDGGCQECERTEGYLLDLIEVAELLYRVTRERKGDSNLCATLKFAADGLLDATSEFFGMDGGGGPSHGHKTAQDHH